MGRYYTVQVTHRIATHEVLSTYYICVPEHRNVSGTIKDVFGDFFGEGTRKIEDMCWSSSDFSHRICIRSWREIADEDLKTITEILPQLEL